MELHTVHGHTRRVDTSMSHSSWKTCQTGSGICSLTKKPFQRGEMAGCHQKTLRIEALAIHVKPLAIPCR